MGTLPADRKSEISKEGSFDTDCPRNVDAAIGVVRFAGENRGAGLTPSKLGDVGWQRHPVQARSTSSSVVMWWWPLRAPRSDRQAGGKDEGDGR